VEDLTLGEQIKSLREARGMSQADLARKVGITQESISRYESGASTPRPRILSRISLIIGLVIAENGEPEEQEYLEDFWRMDPGDRQMVRDFCRRLVAR
jgi:transcriptional regulator with XRE-family HTH domain